MAILSALVYGQILLGATMRHTGAGLAIPDFPLSYGRIVPPFWSAPIAIHFAHRLGALTIVLVALMNLGYVWSRHRDRRELTRPIGLLILLIATQVALGAVVVLSGKQPVVNTLHVATGALVLVTSLVLALRSGKAYARGLGKSDGLGRRPGRDDQYSLTSASGIAVGRKPERDPGKQHHPRLT
jgi:cytochrome c oxidase assembly protein subunit 15